MQNPIQVATSNIPGLTLLNGVNAAFESLATAFSGPAAPTAGGLGLTSLAGIRWYDTATQTLSQRNDADTAWVPIMRIDQTNNKLVLLTATGADGLTIGSAGDATVAGGMAAAGNISAGGNVTSGATIAATGNVLAATPAAFDVSSKVATTQFLKTRGIEASGVTAISASGSLPASAVGGVVNLDGPGTMTLPALAGLADGARIEFSCTGPGATLTAAGSDVIYRTGTPVTSVAMNMGDTLVLVGGGTPVTWTATGGTSSNIGTGQTWQNVKLSRATGTTYTNTTGRPIMVNYFVGNPGGAMAVDGNIVSGAYTNIWISCIVPSGSTYTMTAGAQIVDWLELR